MISIINPIRMIVAKKCQMNFATLAAGGMSAIDKSSLVRGPFKPASEMKMEECASPAEIIEASRPYHPCSVFFDRTLSKFISKGTRKGQRILMKEMMRETFMIIKQTQLEKLNNLKMKKNSDDHQEEDDKLSKIVCDPLEIFHGALENCKPLVITKPVKRGGATYQVPFPISEPESEDLAMRWLFESVKERPKPRKTYFPEEMAKELIDCYYGQGKVVKKKQDMHRQCETNKAYAHYRWG